MLRPAKLVMVQGTSSGAGKSTMVAGLCRIFSNMGFRVSPFKAQNMSSNLFTTADGDMIARAQAVQAAAARIKPDKRMNPIVLKPLGSFQSSIILYGKLFSEMNARDYYEKFALTTGLSSVLRALTSLRNELDVIVIEGAGSPAEINIAKYDIANMVLAQKIRAPVFIVADIERGGCFASIVGTMQLLLPVHKKLVKGFVINKFRGDPALLDNAIKRVETLTRRKIFGIVPLMEFNLPEEDSLDRHEGSESPPSGWDTQIDIIAKVMEESIDIKAILGAAEL